MRQLDNIAKREGVVLLEAPFGYGKTTLLAQLATANDHVFLVTVGGLSADECTELHARLDGAGPDTVVVAIDDASDQFELIKQIAPHPSLRSLILADRVIEGDLEELLDVFELVRIPYEELCFEVPDIAQALGTAMPEAASLEVETLSFALHGASEGWPYLAMQMVSIVASSRDPQTRARELAYPGPDSTAIVERYFAQLPPPVVELISTLGHFEEFTKGCVDTLLIPSGMAGMAEARKSGAYFVEKETSWFTLPWLLARVVRSLGTPPAECGASLTPVLVGTGGTLRGLTIAAQAGYYESASTFLRRLKSNDLDVLDQQKLVDLTQTVRSAVDHPRLALIEARAQFSLGRITNSTSCVSEALKIAEAMDDPDPETVKLAIEARIELLFGRIHAPGVDVLAEAQELRAAIEATVAPEPTLRLRLDEIEAMVLAQSDDFDEVARGAHGLSSVADRWESLLDPVRAVSTLRRMAAIPYTHLGLYDEGIEALDRALKLAWNRLFDRTLSMELHCRFLTIAGRIDGIESVLKEAWALANTTDVSWVKGYLHWCGLWVAAYEGDVAGLLQCLRNAERQFGPLMTHETGALLHAETATALAILGEFDSAEEQVAHSHEILPEGHIEIAFARVVIAARRGDGVEIVEQRIDELLDGQGFPPARMWRLSAERAVALQLADEFEAASSMRQQAMRDAEIVRQGELAERLFDPVFGHGGRPLGTLRPLRIRVLGGFEVAHGAEQCEVPQGHISRLIKMLAMSEGPTALEVIIDELWPNESDVDLGRRRLKNVVSRLRDLIGSDRVVRGEESLALAASCDIDLWSFDALVRESLAADRLDESLALAKLKQALDCYTGPLLPPDLYDDRIRERRAATEARALSGLDRIFDVAPEQRPSAAWMLDVVLRIAPGDDQRLLRVAAQAFDEKHPACARAALEHASMAAEAAGIDLGAEADDLRRLIAAR